MSNNPRLAVLVNSGVLGEPVIELEQVHTGMLLVQVSAEKWLSSQIARQEYASLVGQHFPSHQVFVVAHRQDEEFETALVDFCERLTAYRSGLSGVRVVVVRDPIEGPLSRWLQSDDHSHTFGHLKDVLKEDFQAV